MRKYLQGKKTYMVGAGMVLSGFAPGFGVTEAGTMNLMDCTWQNMNWAMILNGLGLSTLRAGLASYIPMFREKK
jgi:hypothetical protein